MFIQTRILALAAALLAVLWAPHIGAQAQPPEGTVSNYAATQLRTIQGRNSAKAFSIDNVNQRVMNSSVVPVGVAGVNRQRFVSSGASAMGAPRQPLVGNAGMAGSKPFSRVDRGPAVSPYLALNNPFSTAEDYYNIVKPLQEQRRTNDAVARQQYAQQRKLNQIAAMGPYQITGSDRFAPTGHASGFMRLGNYMTTGNYFAPPTQGRRGR